MLASYGVRLGSDAWLQHPWWTATTWIRETLCGLSGHSFELHSEPNRLFLRCADCGQETPGWQVDAPPLIRARR